MAIDTTPPVRVADPLEHYRLTLDTVQREKRRQETQAREQENRRRESEQDAMRERIRVYLTAPIADQGWQFERTGPNQMTLTPSFLPEGITGLRFTASFAHSSHEKEDYLELRRLSWNSNSTWGNSLTIPHGASTELVMAILAPVIVKHVDDTLLLCEQEREQRRLEDEAAEKQRRRQEREAGAAARIDQLKAEHKAGLNERVRSIEEQYGWPKGRLLTAYRIQWTVGFNQESTDRETAWSFGPTPDERGFWSLLGRDQHVQKSIVSPAFDVTKVVWAKVADLPAELTETYAAGRDVAYVDPDASHLDRTYPEWRLSSHVRRFVVVPCELLRSHLATKAGGPLPKTDYQSRRLESDGGDGFVLVEPHPADCDDCFPI
jgi:hypothetical protein